jgi:hypothetical protein
VVIVVASGEQEHRSDNASLKYHQILQGNDQQGQSGNQTVLQRSSLRSVFPRLYSSRLCHPNQRTRRWAWPRRRSAAQ